MTYRIMNRNNQYEVEEKDTLEVVWETDSLSEAKTLTRKLNLGSGFNGFTPSFFNTKIKGPS